MLIEASDEAFIGLLEQRAPHGLQLVDAGWESRGVIQMLQARAQQVRKGIQPAAWLIVESSHVVGMCSLLHAPDAEGTVDIGYGVAPSCRGRGLATCAVGALLAWAAKDSRVQRVTAETSVDNVASQKVLERNGFSRLGERHDPEDGQLVCWSAPTS